MRIRPKPFATALAAIGLLLSGCGGDNTLDPSSDTLLGEWSCPGWTIAFDEDRFTRSFGSYGLKGNWELAGREVLVRPSEVTIMVEERSQRVSDELRSALHEREPGGRLGVNHFPDGMQYGFRGVHALETYLIEQLTETTLKLRMTRLAAIEDSEGVMPEFEAWDCARKRREDTADAAPSIGVDNPSPSAPSSRRRSAEMEDDGSPQFVSTSCTYPGAPEYAGTLKIDRVCEDINRENQRCRSFSVTFPNGRTLTHTDIGIEPDERGNLPFVVLAPTHYEEYFAGDVFDRWAINLLQYAGGKLAAERVRVFDGAGDPISPLLEPSQFAKWKSLRHMPDQGAYFESKLQLSEKCN